MYWTRLFSVVPAASRKQVEVRVETPMASGFFVGIGAAGSLHDVAVVNQIWEMFEEVTGQPVELKAGNWIMEDRDEITGELITGSWRMQNRSTGPANYMSLATHSGVLEFSGTRSPQSHQVLAQLGDRLRDAGFSSYADFTSALQQRSTPTEKKNKTNRGSSKNRSTGKGTGSGRSAHTALVAATAGFELLRDLIIGAVVVGAFIGFDNVRPAIIAATVAVVTLTATRVWLARSR